MMHPCVCETSIRFLWGVHWAVVSVAGDLEGTLGIAAEDLLAGKISLLERIHPHDADIRDRIFSAAVTSVESGFNLRMRHADGRIRLFRGEFHKMLNDAGEIQLELLLQDSRSLWQNQDELANAPNFRAVMENTDDYIYFKDRNHVFTGASQTLVTLTHPIEHWTQLLGKTDYDVFPEEFADIYYKLEKEVFSGMAVAHEVQQTLTKDGTPGWVDNRKYPIRDQDGEIVGLFGIARDITSERRSGEELRQSEEWLEDSQQIAGVGCYDLDIAGDVWTSTVQLDKILGVGKEYPHTIDGWSRIISQEDRPRMDQYLAEEVVGKGLPFENEYRIVRQNDGVLRWVHGTGRLDLDAQGRPWRMRGTIQDITERKFASDALRESKELLQLFIQQAMAALAMFDREMRYLAVSQRWLDDYKLDSAAVIGHSHYEIFPEIPEHWKEAHRRGLAGERIHCDADRFDREDGTVQWLRWNVEPWTKADGAIGGIIVFTEDITEKREAEEHRQLAVSVFTNARESILVTDPTGIILDVNDAFSRVTGYSREEVLGKNPRIFKSGRHSHDFYQEMWEKLNQTGQWAGEIWNRAKDGRIFPLMQTISAVFDAQGKVQHYVCLAFDISILKEHEERLEHFALYDLLTRLPNRVFLADRMHQAMAHCHRRKETIGVAYLDLDAFKAINDSHGHDVGDRLLTTVAARMKLVLRDGDTLARLGGDEFVAVLLDVNDVESSIPVLQRLLLAACEPVEIAGLTLQVSASIGVTFYPQPDEVDADQLLRQADQAMYQAKLEGKNRYSIFDATSDRRIRSRHEEIERMRRGLAAGEFELFYQPKVNMREGRVVGAEALIRWRHPERGLLLPGQFLPIIEDHAMAVEVGEWVIHTALTQMEQWNSNGLHLPVSVNIGARQLQQTEFVHRLDELLRAHAEVVPSQLELEILETSALQDIELTSRMLRKCVELGVSFALDDFGSGYSSLIYLKQLPARVLKIDRNFVRNILEDPEDLTILEGVLGLGFAFRRQCIAEGVETEEQGLMLLRMGCVLAQGFCIARPMPAGELPLWIVNWRVFPSWQREIMDIAMEHLPRLDEGSL